MGFTNKTKVKQKNNWIKCLTLQPVKQMETVAKHTATTKKTKTLIIIFVLLSGKKNI